MELTERQKFKVTLLTLCADHGLSLDETKSCIKNAADKVRQNPAMTKEALWKEILQGLGVGANVAGNVGTAGLLAGIGLPVVGGAGAGLLAAKATGANAENMVEHAKQDEIVGEYERLTEQARRRSRLKALQQATGRKVVSLGG